MKKALMIHEMHDSMTIPEEYVLTFDDGLWTQYQYGRDLPNTKIFFISTGIVCDGEQSNEFIKCHDAHQKAFGGNYENYMTLEQIQELGHQVGAHSHSHTNLNTFDTLEDKVAHIRKDTDLMMEWFEKNLGFAPTSFCFPYNDDFHRIYQALLREYGFTEFYGKERINVDKILV